MVCQCNESVVGLTLSFISSCNHLRCTYSNSCNWRVATKLYISPWLPHCRLFATLISWSWSAYHWHHNQYLCNWHINHSRSPSKHVCTNHQHWSASWLVGALKSFVFEVLAKASSQFRETGIVHNSGMCTSPPASLPLGGQSGLGVYWKLLHQYFLHGLSPSVI